jgi:hypothetical protein
VFQNQKSTIRKQTLVEVCTYGYFWPSWFAAFGFLRHTVRMVYASSRQGADLPPQPRRAAMPVAAKREKNPTWFWQVVEKSDYFQLDKATLIFYDGNTLMQ